jgi:hypothetical protein
MIKQSLSNVILIEPQSTFILSQTSEISLTSKLISFHGILPRSHLTGGYLEDAVASSLDTDPDLHNFVDWTPGSHNPHADIILKNKNNFGISVKSGTLNKEILKISGHRLGKVGGDFNKINKLLMEYRSDVTLCCVYNDFKYSIYYVDKDKFSYPNSSLDWEPIMGKRNGKVSKYVFRCVGDLIVEILPELSWQVWWSIPLLLCRKGIVIDIPKYETKNTKQKPLM